MINLIKDKLEVKEFPLRFLPTFVGSMDRESSQKLQMWFSEHFFAPKLALWFVTPIVSATVGQKWREKMFEKPHSIRLLRLFNSGKTIEKPLKELPWNQQHCTMKFH